MKERIIEDEDESEVSFRGADERDGGDRRDVADGKSCEMNFRDGELFRDGEWR